MNHLKEQIDELYAVHYLCMNIDHGIQYSIKPWKLFIPSSFVYSFFTFNTIYSFDWLESFKHKKPTEWKPEENHEGDLRFPSESKKFHGYIEFLYKKLGEEFPALFHKYLSESLESVDNPRLILEGIALDNRIDQELSDSFQKHFGLVWEKKVQGKRHKDSIKKIAYFVYRVRNNIFHGEKNTVQMMEDKQQKRLRIYSGILSCLSHLLFNVAERELDWVRPSVKIGNEKIGDEVSWKKVFIWSGFAFDVNGNKYDFNKDHKENREYLSKILNQIGYGAFFDGCIFKPNVPSISKNSWLKAVEHLHGGAEGGRYDELPIMDTYVGGIVRTINELGFETGLSCDGHGTRKNRIELRDRHKSYVLDVTLRAISKGKYGYENSSIVRVKNKHIHDRRPVSIDRDYLLDVAELLHENKTQIKKLTDEIVA